VKDSGIVAVPAQSMEPLHQQSRLTYLVLNTVGATSYHFELMLARVILTALLLKVGISASAQTPTSCRTGGGENRKEKANREKPTKATPRSVAFHSIGSSSQPA